jgi:peroxiredoxin
VGVAPEPGSRPLAALYQKARSKSTRGAATLALAQYRWKQAEGAFGRKLETPPIVRNEQGEILTMPEEMDDYEKAHYERDPAPFRAEAFRLLEEVIHDHSDEPYDTRRGTTFGQKARELFDEWANLAVGQPAPSFEGKDLAEKPVKLADYRGRVVVLVFWASWCEPCVKQIPIEKELARRFQDRPFALLGVNCDESSEQARKVAPDKELTWASLFDGSKRLGPCEIDMGPVARLYHVNRLPSVYLIDAQGIIRQKRTSVVDLEESVENLLKEIEPKPGEPR